jgi:hypothetical protein
MSISSQPEASLQREQGDGHRRHKDLPEVE